MEMTISLPPQETIDFNQTCYAYMIIGVTTFKVIQVGRTVDEAKKNALRRLDNAKPSYKKYMYRAMDKATLENPSNDVYHKGIRYQIAECDMKYYIHFLDQGKRRVKFIFESAIPPYRIKYSR